MRPRLALLLLLIVGLPLGLLLYLGDRLARDEQAALKAQLLAATQSTERARQEKIAGALEGLLREIAIELDGLPAGSATGEGAGLLQAQRRPQAKPLTSADLRALGRSHRRLRCVLWQQADGGLLHPPAEGPRSEDEDLCLQRLRRLLDDGALLQAPVPGSPETGGDTRAGLPSGWRRLHWGEELTLLYWRRLADESVLAFELNPGRLHADLISRLPHGAGQEEQQGTKSSAGAPMEDGSCRRLLDGEGQALYVWGQCEALDPGQPHPLEDAMVLVGSPLAPPLETWRLETRWRPGGAALGSTAGVVSARRSLWRVVLISLGLGLVLLGFLVWRELSRAAREAGERVNFVNRVSHELKTPLTNIRLYAELLEGRLGDEDPKSTRFLNVIVGESRRLSRLIGNVLSFGRQQRRSLQLQPSPGVVDRVIDEVLETFGPSLQEHGIEVERGGAAPREVQLDADALEQILGNLVSNVEKYAASGGFLGLAVRQEGQRSLIDVYDRGPGIPARQRRRVFRPFYRVSSKLSDGVAGTGIGLTIARELARQHQGDLQLVADDASPGARFRVSLWTPAVLNVDNPDDTEPAPIHPDGG